MGLSWCVDREMGADKLIARMVRLIMTAGGRIFRIAEARDSRYMHLLKLGIGFFVGSTVQFWC